jgi:hypothetical protein
VRLEASTKPPIHNLIHEFLINMAFTMACPNFKTGLKMAFGPLGVNVSAKLKDYPNLKSNFIHFLFVVKEMCVEICFFSHAINERIFSFFFFLKSNHKIF